MDNERFDRLTKRLATGANRRGILKGLVGGAAAAIGVSLTRQGTAALHDPDEQCRHETGIFCSNTEPAPGHTCCAPNYACSSPTGGGTCQCAPDYIECGPAEHASAGGNACIHESHCCTDGRPGCPEDQECRAGDNGQYACRQCAEGFATCNGQCISTEHCCASDNRAPFDVCEDGEACVNGACEQECVPKDGTCNKSQPCCHPDQLICSSTTDEPGTCQECVAVDQRCNKFHPCCHPEEFVCSSGTEREGSCERRDGETCDETKDTLCKKDGFKSKCCPGKGRPCNENKNGTFNCGIKDQSKKQGEVRTQSRKSRKRRKR